MAEPVMTEMEKKKAKVAAIKDTMAGITKAKTAEAEQLGGVGAKIGAAYEQQGKATKQAIGSTLATQLSQQEGMGGSYNKAAARQQAATAGLQTGMALGGIGVSSAKDVGAAETAATQAKTEAAAQIYEQLTGEQKLEKEMEEGMAAETTNFDKAIDNAITTTKGGGDDNEELAVQNLIDLYNQNKKYFDENPVMKKKILDKVAGISKEAFDSDFGGGYGLEDSNPSFYKFLVDNGYSESDWNNATEIDY